MEFVVSFNARFYMNKIDLTKYFKNCSPLFYQIFLSTCFIYDFVENTDMNIIADSFVFINI